MQLTRWAPFSYYLSQEIGSALDLLEPAAALSVLRWSCFVVIRAKKAPVPRSRALFSPEIPHHKELSVASYRFRRRRSPLETAGTTERKKSTVSASSYLKSLLHTFLILKFIHTPFSFFPVGGWVGGGKQAILGKLSWTREHSQMSKQVISDGIICSNNQADQCFLIQWYSR